MQALQFLSSVLENPLKIDQNRACIGVLKVGNSVLKPQFSGRIRGLATMIDGRLVSLSCLECLVKLKHN